MAVPEAVIFDLDGTLVQTRESSWLVFEPINRRHGLGIDEPEQFYELFAGNLFERLRDTCPDEATADAVIADFLAALEEHYQPSMVPGIVDVVRKMAPRSRLAVLSSNATSVVRRVLRGNGVEFCFAHVFGGDVEPDKIRGIDRFLADAATGSGRLCHAYYDERQVSDGAPADPSSVVLVTDTVGDIEAASAAGIRAVGVSWGMHTEEQLLAAGAEFVAIWPQELLSHLYSPADSDSSSCTTGCDVDPVRATANSCPSTASDPGTTTIPRESAAASTSTGTIAAELSAAAAVRKSRRASLPSTSPQSTRDCGCRSASVVLPRSPDPELAASVGLIMSASGSGSRPGPATSAATGHESTVGRSASAAVRTAEIPSGNDELTVAMARMIA